jgi:hypothetical protein
MEKFGVQFNEEAVKKAVETGACPKCGSHLLESYPPQCPNCGSEPFEAGTVSRRTSANAPEGNPPRTDVPVDLGEGEG